MTSQISTHNLIKLEIRQTFWMFALSCLAQFMAGPVLLLLSVEDDFLFLEDTIYRYRNFFGNTYLFVQILVMILCICFTIFSYRYLFSKRMTDLYHSVPITRGKLFLVKYVHGFLVWFIPFAVFGIITLLMSLLRLNVHLTLSYFGMIALSFCKTVLLSLFCFFVFYHLYLAAVYLSGNVLNMFANVAIMGFSVIALFGLILVFMQGCFDTFCYTVPDSLADVLMAFSPFALPFYLCILTYDISWSAFFTEHALLLPVSFLLSVLLLVIAKRLSGKRPSELAERGTVHKGYTFLSKIFVSFLAGLAFSLFFASLGTSSMELFWGIFGAIFGSLLCYGAINSIYHTTIKAFFKNRIAMIAAALCSTLLSCAFFCDFFHYDDYLPEKEQIAGIAVFTNAFTDNSQNYVLTATSDSYTPSNVSYSTTSSQKVVQENLLTDKEICYDFLLTAIDGCKDTSASHYSTSVYAKIQLKNGRTYYRRYRLCNCQYELLRPFIESEDYKNTNYKVSGGLLGYPVNITVDFELEQASYTITGDTVSLIMDAFVQDFEEHYQIENLSTYLYDTSLSLMYGNAQGGYRYFYLNIPSFYERTLTLLHSLYPDYGNSLSSAEEIVSITPICPQNISDNQNYDTYFQMADAAAKTTEDTAADTPDSADIRTEDVMVQYYYRENEVTITDSAFIELLFPHLYFGYNVDYLDLNEYIYFGEVKSVSSYYPISCYVKANTVPREIIDYLNSFVTSEEDF